MAQQSLTPQQRANMFAQATRQNFQMVPAQTATTGSTTLQFSMPKARLLSKISFDVKAKVKIKHASKTTIEQDVFSPYRLLRRISLDLNNGFSPYSIGSEGILLYNMVRMNPSVVFPQRSDEHGYNYFPQMVASSAGAENAFNFTVELPITLNERDPQGLILAQNNETQITVSVDLANGGDIFQNQQGYEVTITEVTITPYTESFSIPAVPEAFPDLSVLKLVTSRLDAFQGSGENVIRLATGTIYRKLIFYVMDDDGKPFEDADILSPISLVFNQADINYNIRAENLRHQNESMLGYALPKGAYCFDFSYNGLTNLGGTRDLIDTEMLSEFWLKFNSTKRGRIMVVSENIARLV